MCASLRGALLYARSKVEAFEIDASFLSLRFPFFIPPRFSSLPVGCYAKRAPGAMAQLVARLVRNEKVRGSNPLSSTVSTR